MCQILMLAKDIPSANRFEFDPVSLENDDFTFSAGEDIRIWTGQGNTAASFPDLFYIIQITGLDKSRINNLMEVYRTPALPSDPEFNAQDAEDRYIYQGPHKWGFANLPGPIKAQLRNNKIYIVAWQESLKGTINSYLENRLGITEDLII